MHNNVIPFPRRQPASAVVVPIVAAAPRLSAEVQRSFIKSLRLAGMAARKGNPLAKDLLRSYAALQNEPYLSGFAKRILRDLDAADAGCFPCDVEVLTDGGVA